MYLLNSWKIQLVIQATTFMEFNIKGLLVPTSPGTEYESRVNWIGVIRVALNED